MTIYPILTYHTLPHTIFLQNSQLYSTFSFLTQLHYTPLYSTSSSCGLPSVTHICFQLFISSSLFDSLLVRDGKLSLLLYFVFLLLILFLILILFLLNHYHYHFFTCSLQNAIQLYLYLPN